MLGYRVGCKKGPLGLCNVNYKLCLLTLKMAASIWNDHQLSLGRRQNVTTCSKRFRLEGRGVSEKFYFSFRMKSTRCRKCRTFEKSTPHDASWYLNKSVSFRIGVDILTSPLPLLLAMNEVWSKSIGIWAISRELMVAAQFHFTR